MHEHINASTLLTPKPKQVKIETFASSKTCTRGRVDHISTLAVGVIVCDLCLVNLGNSVGLKVFIAHLEPGYRLPLDRYFIMLQICSFNIPSTVWEGLVWNVSGCEHDRAKAC